VSHIFGALSVLKMRHASMRLAVEQRFPRPAFGAAAERERKTDAGADYRVMPERYIMTSRKGGGMDETRQGVSARISSKPRPDRRRHRHRARHVLGRGFTPPVDL
jgi:hypothetical protein